MKKESRNFLIVLIIGMIFSLLAGYLFQNYFSLKYWGTDLTWDLLTIGFSLMIFYNSLIWSYMNLQEKNNNKRIIINTFLIVYILLLYIQLMNFLYWSVRVNPFFLKYYLEDYMSVQLVGLIPLFVFLIWFYLKRRNSKPREFSK
jgi:hypothetical protein